MAGQQREPRTGGDEVGGDGEVVDVVTDLELAPGCGADAGRFCGFSYSGGRRGSMTWSETDRANVIVGTTEAIRVVNALERTGKQGPSTSAAAAGETVRCESLETSDSWPDFGPTAAGLGLHSVATVPLTSQCGVIGSISLYSEVDHGLDDRAVELAEAFATSATQLLQNASVHFRSQRAITEMRSAEKTAAVIRPSGS